MNLVKMAAMAALTLGGAFALTAPANAMTTINVVKIEKVGPTRNAFLTYNGFNGLAGMTAFRFTLDDGSTLEMFCTEPEDTMYLGAVNLTFGVSALQAGDFANSAAVAAFTRYGLSSIGANSPVGSFGVATFGVGAAFNLANASTAALYNDALTAISGFTAADFNLDGVFKLTQLGVENGRGVIDVQNGTTMWSPSSGVIPEPATWAMMIAGFGLVGAAARRRRPTAMATVTA